MFYIMKKNTLFFDLETLVDVECLIDLQKVFVCCPGVLNVRKTFLLRMISLLVMYKCCIYNCHMKTAHIIRCLTSRIIAYATFLS